MTEPDRDLLQRVLEDEGIRSHGSDPTWIAWAGDRLSSFVHELLDSLQQVEGMGPIVWAIAAALVFVLAVLAALTGVRLFRVWSAARVRDPDGEPVQGLEALDAPDTRRYRAEAERALAAGQPREAVRAAWLWVAWTLHERAVGGYEPDLTNREFVDRVRATTPRWAPLPELHRFARTVDRLCYDDVDPAEADARALLGAAGGLLDAPA